MRRNGDSRYIQIEKKDHQSGLIAARLGPISGNPLGPDANYPQKLGISLWKRKRGGRISRPFGDNQFLAYDLAGL
jgi:hypothetical protein